MERAGGTVHWCSTAEDARAAMLAICRKAGARTVTKGKSMISEEIGVNDHLEAHGIAPVETDLGEYILQLRQRAPVATSSPPPSTSTARTGRRISAACTPTCRPTASSPSGATSWRRRARKLRDRFLAADVGITGANFLIAETGSSVIVTNEGNGDLTQTLPRVHIALASIEKVVPTLEDATSLLRLLARSATGQDFSVYTTFSTGARRPGDLDGPEEYHVVLLDNGRSNMLGTEFGEMLRCIRCAACMNHCPVYGAVGGHAYGWVYPGPMGSVLTPALAGIERTANLPNASTFCGKCESVCPVKIPLPKMMRHWREREFERHLTPAGAAAQPRALALRRAAAGALPDGDAGGGGGARRCGPRARRVRSLPFAGGWTEGRDLPLPEGRGRHLHGGLRQAAAAERRADEQGRDPRHHPPQPAARPAAGRPGGDAGRAAGDASAPPHPGPLAPAAAGAGGALRAQPGEGVRHGGAGAGRRRRARRGRRLPRRAEPALALRHGAARGAVRDPLGRPAAAGDRARAAPSRRTRSACSTATPASPRRAR